MSNSSKISGRDTQVPRRVYPAIVEPPIEKPAPAKPKKLWQYKRFWLLFGLPNIFAIVYYGLIASPIYVSHASLEVSGSGRSSDALASLLTGYSASGGTGAYVVQDFIATPDEFKRVDSHFDLAAQYKQYDFISRFGSFGSMFSHSDIALWSSYKKAAQVTISKSGIAEIAVHGPTAQQAHDVALFILNDTVDHIRNLNRREQVDYTSAANGEVERLEKALQEDQRTLQAFRVRTGIYQPASYFTTMTTHMTELLLKRLDTSAKIAGLLGATPNSIAAKAFTSQLSIIDSMIDKAHGNIAEINQTSAEFAALETKQDIDARLLAQAQAALMQSSIKASQDHYYIHKIGYPSLLQGSEYPNRLFNIFLVFCISALVIAVARPTR